MLPFKTRCLNFFRSFIRGTCVEGWLENSIRNHGGLSSFLRKLIPNNYQYQKPVLRKFAHDGLTYSVDISDYIGHTGYFGLNQHLIKIFQLSKPTDVVFANGVNLGWTALNLSRICHEVQAYRFEPDTTNF
jgi:hypothetical protein